MIKELLCVLIVLVTSIIPSTKVHNFASDLIQKTFVISEPKDDNMSNQAVKVFGNSKALKELISDDERKKVV